ncbi:hypothetical protein AB0J86_18310 [Micromonospora sp. NPDC049559]|uniref:hypothetical protein n=1 Tax=Micromonospora sp. NPDC049559 TaxID=3155923 RepID=UPI00343109C1
MSDVLAEAKRLTAGLVSGQVSREDAADWAMDRIRDEEADYASDAALWSALDRLAGADLRTDVGSYLHGPEDFRAWLSELES